MGEENHGGMERECGMGPAGPHVASSHIGKMAPQCREVAAYEQKGGSLAWESGL